MTPPPLLFEEATSPLTQSNDGQIYVQRDRENDVWQIRSEADPTEILIETHDRVIADAYIAGYDEARRLEAEEPS